MVLFHSSENPHKKPAAGLFSFFASLLNTLHHKTERPIGFIQSTFLRRVLLFRLASSFSPMRCHKNGIPEFLEKLFFEKNFNPICLKTWK